VKAKAPGKVVVSGAYAVLDGAPAIVSAVSRYALADASRTATFVTEEVKAAGLSPAPWFNAAELRAGDRKLGLGSSAAILVASLAAVQLAQQVYMDDESLAAAVLPRALEAHAAAQPLGSGIDICASCMGGTLIVTRKGDSVEHHSITFPPELFIEIWAAPNSCNTHDMLLRVRDYRRTHDDRYGRRMSEQSLASERAALAARVGDARSFISALRAQRFALEALGRDAGLVIVTPEVSELDELAANESATVLPAGAGGGDIALFAGLRPPSDRLRIAMASLNHAAIDVNYGVRGVHRVGGEC